MFTNILGIVHVLKHMSLIDKMDKKKYMGVCRWESVQIARKMTMFPKIVTIYMHRNIPYIRGCSLGSFVIPRR